MSRHITPAVALTLTIVLSVASASPTLPTFRVGISSSFLDTPFFVVLMHLTTKAAQSAGLSWSGPTDAHSDPGKQLSDIQTLISGGAQGLLVVPRDSDAIAPALNYAANRHIPVVAIDVGIHSGHAAITVRADNIAMAHTACEAIGTALHGQGEVLELQGDLLNSSGRDRTQGFESCIKERYPHMTVIARPTRWEQARAADAAQTILAVHPNLAAIYMQSGDIMLPGVLSVLRSADREAKLGDPRRIYLVTINGSPFELQKIRSGELDAAVSQPLNLYAQLGVEYLQRAVRGDTFAEGPTNHNSRIVRNTSGNLEDLLPAPLVTKANVDDPKLWGNQAGN